MVLFGTTDENINVCMHADGFYRVDYKHMTFDGQQLSFLAK